jgi:hypothetical protein
MLCRVATSQPSKIAEWQLPTEVITPHQLDKVKTSSLVQRGIFLHAAKQPSEEILPLRDLAEAYVLYKAAAVCCFPKALQEFAEKVAVLQTLTFCAT